MNKHVFFIFKFIIVDHHDSAMFKSLKIFFYNDIDTQSSKYNETYYVFPCLLSKKCYEK